MTRSALVLGAGMVGTCTALHLAFRGYEVTLVDRREPGRETSYGNAGIIQREAVEPYAFPRGIPALLSAAFKRGADVNYHLGALPRLAAPLLRYWANSGPARYPAIARDYARLTEHATSEHARLIDAASAQDLVQRAGYRAIFRQTASLDAALTVAQRWAQDYGVSFVPQDSGALAAAEPALRQRLAGAIHWTDPWSVSDPGELVERYAALLARSGGRVVRGDAVTLRATATGWAVQTDAGTVDAGQTVIALGPWADTVLAPLGYRLPLFVKRGYHRHYTGTGPNLPLLDADRGLVIAPMKRGVRLTTGAELTDIDAPATPWQLERAETSARELLDLPQPVEPAPWRGARPCTPDMKPVIGAAPRHPGLWFNFGHSHQGFTLGPVSGRLLAELMDGERPVVDPQPYGPQRLM